MPSYSRNSAGESSDIAPRLLTSDTEEEAEVFVFPGAPLSALAEQPVPVPRSSTSSEEIPDLESNAPRSPRPPRSPRTVVHGPPAPGDRSSASDKKNEAPEIVVVEASNEDNSTSVLQLSSSSGADADVEDNNNSGSSNKADSPSAEENDKST